MSEFIKIDKLQCKYPGGFRLKEVCFTVRRGSFTGIIGPNGSGKTTLFKSITGEIPVIAGNILVDGIDLKTMSLRDRAKKIAIVTQNTEISHITVEDYVLMGRLPYRSHFQLFENSKDYLLANKFMKLTGTLSFKDKLMSELSGGEQQLVAIARALTQEPELLLLDEPTSHLDISHQVQVLNLIQKLNEEMSLTVLMIIHDLNLAGEYCEHLVMMDNGKVFSRGIAEEILNYKDIETVYKTVVLTKENPLSGKPAVFLISDKTLKMTSKGEVSGGE
jgi:iron complex transport system ATP-binding protein